MSHTLASIAEYIDAQLIGEADIVINGVGTLQAGQAGEIGFLAESNYKKYLAQTKLSAVIVDAPAPEVACAQLVVKEVKKGWRQVVALFARPLGFAGIDASAIIAPSANIGRNARIGAGVSIGAHTVIGDDAIIAAGVHIADKVRIGANAIICAGAIINADTVIGDRVYIDSGAVIGSRGFGFSLEAGRWHAIEQVGCVRIGDDVEIGACTTIDRGAVGDTIIGNGVKLDNQIQVGHNVEIGEHTIIAGCCVIAGSVKFGRHCAVGGASVFAGHINICDGVQFTGHSSITKSIDKAGTYSSAFPVLPNRLWNRLVANVRRLDKS